MGVDSGLPDFRGDKGFWSAYPLYEKLGLKFDNMATPLHFENDPAFGWGFYGHRNNLYRDTTPHRGFSILLDWIDRLRLDWFVVTSNVDGHFQRAGFDGDKILEVHGSIHHIQCLRPCVPQIWALTERIAVDLETMRAELIPRCMNCNLPARPNVLMFNDWSWIPERTRNQQRRFDAFTSRCSKPIIVIEFGAGRALPTIRYTSEQLGREEETTVIRINPREPQISQPHISIAAGALEALENIDRALLQD